MELRNQVVLVTGASSGIGRAIMQALAEMGCRVYGAGRNGIQQEDIRAGILSLRMDVTDERSVKSAVGELLGAEGRIDILVHCAGMGISGPLEYADDSALRLQFDTNVFGALRLCRAVLGPMRKSGKGRIVLFGSVAGRISIPFQAAYSASKAAISSFASALRMEAGAFGIECTVVEPGDIKTGFTQNRVKQKLPPSDVYAASCDYAVSKMEHDEQNGGNPEQIARCVIRRVLLPKHAPVRYVPGLSYRLLTLLARILPDRLIEYLVKSVYLHR